MKKILSLFVLIIAYSCSTSTDDNGNSNTTVVPLPPTNLTGTVASTSQINLTWTDNSTNETGFKIERKTGTGTYEVVGTTATDITTFNNTGLTPNTTYTYRVYSYNAVGNSLSYTNEVTLTTNALLELPNLTTTAASSITQTTASSGGNISSDGGAVITARGVCWSTSPNPTIVLSTKTTDGTGIGAFTSNITGLSANTTYYVRAYATNSVGTAYGNEVNFIATTPNYAAMYSAGTVFCNNVVTAVVDVTNPITGKTWMDRNLGASQVANSSTDSNAYGDLYQWGRRADGHQCRNSTTITTLSSTDQPPHGDYINNSSSWDWRSPSNNNLWQGINGINNPCPIGYRLPTESELNSERLSWSINNSDGGFNSVLKLTLGGYRVSSGIVYPDVSQYLSSTVSIGGFQPDGSSQSLSLKTTNAGVTGINSLMKKSGASIRCIKN